MNLDIRHVDLDKRAVYDASIMNRMPLDTYGYHFITEEYIPDGANEYYLRDQQIASWNAHWRHLTEKEILALEDQGNTCHRWEDVLVEDPIDLRLIRNNSFYGLVRIGSMEKYTVSFHDFVLPEGIYDCHIISCDIGRHSALHRCGYVSHYIIGPQCILSEIDEMDATNHAKFGNGIVKDGEDEAVRIWLNIMNEAESRSVLPFDTMICADAWLWGTFREDGMLLEKLKEFTNQAYDNRRGWYATVGSGSVIKSCRVIKDVAFGEYVYVKGANKLKNLTICSCADASTQIGEGVELVNGIIGYGCHVFYGVKAVRFVMGDNSNLKYGARLINSVLGDNSTISCCEVLNALVFPFHEQHHNNSFLIAALIMGQSNMAAGANIGSNHNTRGNDGEMQARRGFWPALSSSIKYNSRFASFTLLAKGDYPHELNISIPFSLVDYDEQHKRLVIMPAYWWLYNRYALERNEWKFRVRDKRKFIRQHIESDYMAPDTMEEILEAMDMLCLWVGRAALRSSLIAPYSATNDQALREQGRILLERHPEQVSVLEVTAVGFERSSEPSIIIKAEEGYRAYREMLIFSAMRMLLKYLEHHHISVKQFEQEGEQRLKEDPLACMATEGPFFNMGGQIVSEKQIQSLINQIKDGSLRDWDAVHHTYDNWWDIYEWTKAMYAAKILKHLMKVDMLHDEVTWKSLIDQFVILCDQNAAEVFRTRQKDYEEPFRKMMYRNQQEINAVLGNPEDNTFVRDSRLAMDRLQALARRFSPPY